VWRSCGGSAIIGEANEAREGAEKAYKNLCEPRVSLACSAGQAAVKFSPFQAIVQRLFADAIRRADLAGL
jgi:hypothetical protein